jgi:two-component system nitrate/nitrite response regulator NarL
MITLGIVDDHQIVIDGLISLLDGHEGYRIAFATTEPQSVMSLLRGNDIDLLLTDVQMPVLPGNELAKLVRESYPDIRILALSMSGLGHVVSEMIGTADLAGYVLKNIGKRELIHAIDKIAAGGIYFSDSVLEELRVETDRRKAQEAAHLSSREIEIVALIEQELNNKEIADRLFISERTVETHRKNIFRKTGTNSVLGLIKWAYAHHIISRR